MTSLDGELPKGLICWSNNGLEGNPTNDNNLCS
jgi:hypothetical protein